MTLSDLQKQVGEWHVKTFGDAGKCTNKRIGRKLLEESAECFVAAEENGRMNNWGITQAKLANELADVVIACLALAARNEIELMDACEVKFAAVQGRKYSGTDLNQG